MPIYWLNEDSVQFPPPELASEEGILAIGGDLSPERLLEAYSQGIFPWFNDDDPILWWTPDPRFVLFPKNLKVSKSMRPLFNQKKMQVTFDQEFRTVITNCQQMYRPGQGGTWITKDMLEAYCTLHDLGFAHSVEVWQNQELVGGLYGISLGKVFFGESMFAKVSNASKFGFISLVRKLQEWDFNLIDCQQETAHLASLGAEAIPRADFLRLLDVNPLGETVRGKWGVPPSHKASADEGRV
ncbi:MAG: leucyl/phenylalanyl-tRNA--protein transferase [Bacteroidota bacterium]